MRNKKLIIVFTVIFSLALLIILGSVIFSVQKVIPSCFNNSETESTDKLIIEKASIKKGGSIFLINEKDIIRRIEKEMSAVKVLNVERKFPNTVYVNYVIIEKYFEFYHNGVYYRLGNNLRIIDSSAEPDPDCIKLKLNGMLSTTEIGSDFVFSDLYETQLIKNILLSLERLGYSSEIKQLFEFIDLKKNGFIYMKTRSGVVFEVQGTEKLFDKIHGGMSVYNDEDSYKLSGTIICSSSKIFWNPEDLYNKGN